MIRAPESLLNTETHVLLIPVGMWQDEGGLAEGIRIRERQLQKMGVGVTVLARRDHVIALLNTRWFHYLIGLGRLLLGLRLTAYFASFALRPLVKRMPRFDALLIYTFPLTIDVILLALLRQVAPRLVLVTLHDPNYHNEKTNLRKRLLYKKLVRNVWELSANHRNFYVHLFNPKLLSGIEVPAGAKLFFQEHGLPEPRAVRKRADGRIRVGFLGRIEAYKGLPVLFRALHAVRPKLPEDLARLVTVVIAGDGALDQGEIKRMEFPLILENRFISDNEFHQHMADLDLLVLPYIEATQSGVVAMALGYGRRCVVSAVGGIPELAGKSPFTTLVPASDPEALVSAIVEHIVSIGRG